MWCHSSRDKTLGNTNPGWDTYGRDKTLSREYLVYKNRVLDYDLAPDLSCDARLGIAKC